MIYKILSRLFLKYLCYKRKKTKDKKLKRKLEEVILEIDNLTLELLGLLILRKWACFDFEYSEEKE